MTSEPAIVVSRIGVQALIQDDGRIGLSHIGVGRAGAYDRRAMRQANGLVGNAPGDAVVECLLGGLQFQVLTDVVISVCGAIASISVMAPTRDTPRLLTSNEIIELGEGDIVALGRPKVGLRTYLAVSGGIAVDPVLGSRSHDTLSRLGPNPLAAGDRIPIGHPNSVSDTRSIGESFAYADEPDRTLRVEAGPDIDDLTGGLDRLSSMGCWTVHRDSDRIGLRLDPAEPIREPVGALPTAPTMRGAVQLTPGGQLVIFGPDAPISGGYPVVGIVTNATSDSLAQLRPGQRVSFSPF